MKNNLTMKAVALFLQFMMVGILFVACVNDDCDLPFNNKTKATRSVSQTAENITIDDRENNVVDSIKIYEPFDKLCRIKLTATADIIVNVQNSGGMLTECKFKYYNQKLDTLPYHYYNPTSRISRLELHFTANDSIAIYYEARLDTDDYIYDPVNDYRYPNPAALERGNYAGVEYFGVPWHMEAFGNSKK